MFSSAALSIEDGEKALICFDYSEQIRCEIFDGSKIKSTHASTHRHAGGKLGFYKGKPTTVGGEHSNKVETWSKTSGWSSLPDFPE